MPISRKQFTTGNFPGQHKTSEITKKLQSIFKKNRQTAYTVKELAKELEVSKWAISGKLPELRKEGVIAHRSPYWIYNNARSKPKSSKKSKSSRRKR